MKFLQVNNNNRLKMGTPWHQIITTILITCFGYRFCKQGGVKYKNNADDYFSSERIISIYLIFLSLCGSGYKKHDDMI